MKPITWSISILFLLLAVLVDSSTQQITRANTTDCVDNEFISCGKCTRIYNSSIAGRVSSAGYAVVCTACQVGQPNDSNAAVFIEPSSGKKGNPGQFCDDTYLNLVWLSVGIAAAVALVAGISFWIYNSIKRKQLRSRSHADIC